MTGCLAAETRTGPGGVPAGRPECHGVVYCRHTGREARAEGCPEWFTAGTRAAAYRGLPKP